MSLESKAKTVVGLHYLYELEAEGDFAKENELWVPLEEAQKLDQLLSAKMADLQQLTHDIGELEGLKNNWKRHAEDEQHEKIQLSIQIEKVNKILDGFPAYCFVDMQKIEVIRIPILKDWLLELHNALLIPRKEESET